MKIKLDLIGEEGLLVNEAIESQWLSSQLGPNSAYSARTAGHFKAALIKAGEVVHVRGEIAIGLTAACSRCLVEVPSPVRCDVEVALFPEEKAVEPGLEMELCEEDLGVALYRDQEIDLGEIVRDEVVLQLPISLVCRNSCAGLCDNCGANLNEGVCGCPERFDIRWSALQNVKLKN